MTEPGVNIAELESMSPAVMEALKSWATPYTWAQFNGLILPSGDKFDIYTHPYEIEIINDDHPNQAVKKPSQVGISTSMIIKILNKMIYAEELRANGMIGYKHGVIYVLPTLGDVEEFSKDKFNPIIGNNPFILKFVRKGLGGAAKDTETTEIKKINKSFLYIKSGTEKQNIKNQHGTSSSLKSKSVDLAVIDERDHTSDDMVDLAKTRLFHSDVASYIELGTPTLVGYGIDKSYQKSDMMTWYLECPKDPRHLTCLEMEFLNDPDRCIKHDLTGRSYRACLKCGAELHPGQGRWIANSPDVKDKRGRWFSQMISQHGPYAKDPYKIVEDYYSTDNKKEFYNSVLGMAFIEEVNKLTENDVLRCCGDYPISHRHEGPCAMGVDVHDKFLYVVVGYPITPTSSRLIHLTKVDSFEALIPLGIRLGVKACCIDKEPDTHKSREFQKDASKFFKVFLVDYQTRLKTMEKLDEESGVLTVRRNEVLDATHDLITIPGRLELPSRSAIIFDFAKQCCALIKTLSTDKKTGAAFYEYLPRSKNDHWRHTLNYFYLACRENSLKYAVQSMNRVGKGGVNRDYERNSYDPLGRTQTGLYGFENNFNRNNAGGMR